MIRKAVLSDLPQIEMLLRNTVAAMNEAGNYQWDESYPLAAHFAEDIQQNELYVYLLEGKLAGVVCISSNGHEEYNEINWTYQREDALTIKRAAVDPAYQGQGIASALYQHAEVVAAEKDLAYIKTDTFGKNQTAQHLFIKNGYEYTDEKLFPDKDDKLMYFEKKLHR